MSAKRSPKAVTSPEEKETTTRLLPNGFKACVVSKSSVAVPLPPPEDTSSTVSSSSLADGENERGNWGRQLDFFLSCVGYAVGLGNIWRFPYLCYQSGGGAFLVPYLLFLVVCGMPLFFMEMSFGQFASLGPITIWKICPLFKGLGYGMVIISGIVCIYYNVIIAWTLYYIYHSYDVVWATCDNWWNTADCVKQSSAEFYPQNTSLLTNSSSSNFESVGNNSVVDVDIKTISNATRKTSSEEFWLYNVLHQSAGIDELGEIQWPLALTLFIAWFVVFLCLQKGIKSSGKVVYVSATFPYVVLVCLLIRGVTLPGAWNGIVFYLSPRWELLLSFKVWGDAATQIFYSVGAAWGAVLTMASYNKFSNNVYRDAMLIPIINCATSIFAGFVVFSIIGFMAYETGNSIEEVVSEGPGLAFVVYPEAVSRLPLSPLWAFLFFIMLFAIGLDSQFGMFETAISAFVDEFPTVLQKRKPLFTAVLCFVMFLLGLPCVTEGGMYVLQLMDWYSAAFSLMIISLLELICISWIYGIDRFFMDISLMIKRPPSLWWKLCWCYITPGTIVCLLTFIIINHEAVSYDDYKYPKWSIVCGWMIAMCSIVPIPILAVVQLLKAEGSFKERLISCLQPTEKWGPALEEHRILYKKSLSLVSSRFPQKRELIANQNASTDQRNIDGVCMVQTEDALLTAESCI
ncbi:sodium- and chloride-dependent glycine transporter 1-like [Argiope bruennichi]|uniref:Transporter n=1 Tax=Argiope bruennichi TaxID=94029 RepID=A0A8T0FHS2_ARGBR|nr:sodium- and chloride-dependent glycine transporter 1-like [Argiope bruennichi]KAF8790807.1 Sodium- and chloride-dependent glycine like protein [Argiope bruennichi]